jgi:acyl dehydratase
VDASHLPRALATIRQPLPTDLVHSAVLGLGDAAHASRDAFDRGLIPPDVLVGASLFLLASQPRAPRADGAKPKGAVAGGVWVREQVTFHHPVAVGQELVISGESAQRFVKRGRLYGVTICETHSAEGCLLVSNRTTGLLRYRKEEGAPDEQQGLSDSELPPCAPDWAAAVGNPAREQLAALRVGDRIEAPRAVITLEMMRARDGKRDQNPIHTDPEVARREGLAAPIAGGSHVLSFLLEALMRAWTPEALLHGAHLDVRWTGQTYAGTGIESSAEVVRAEGRSVLVALEVRGEDRIAMSGTLEVPLGDGPQPGREPLA